jgi:hypothetical protein
MIEIPISSILKRSVQKSHVCLRIIRKTEETSSSYDNNFASLETCPANSCSRCAVNVALRPSRAELVIPAVMRRRRRNLDSAVL